MEYHRDRFEDYSLLVFKNQKLIAVMPANKSGHAVHSHQGLTYGGLVIDKSIKFEVVLSVFRDILKYLHEHQVKTFHIKQLPCIYCSLPSDEIQYIMFVLKAKLVRRDTLSVIDLNQPVNISRDRMGGVNRGKKFLLEIREDKSLDAFWNEILIPNLSEKHGTQPVHSLEEISLLKRCFPNQIRQFNVYDKNELVAGTTIFESENVAHSQYISSTGEKNLNGSLDFLHFHLITDVFKNKKFFDFGISNENQGKNVNKGLMYWKEGFGARTVTQDFFEVNTENYNLLETVLL